MAAADAMRRPIATFASGPTNSMRGAAFLSGLQEAIVVDIGGTTSDVGTLQVLLHSLVVVEWIRFELNQF